jgi:hypothetical protein
MASPSQQIKPNLTYEQMLTKLDEFYNQRDELQSKLEEICYDIEFLETMIMYRYNKGKLEWHH